MKKYMNLLTSVGAFLILGAIAYLFCAALALSFDFTDWHLLTRVLFCVTVVTNLFGSIFVYTEYEKKNRK